jgi:pimeloyl-ACP methyl ester carboxylesterase
MKITANNASLHLLDSGAHQATAHRPALVFAHFFGGSSRSWREVGACLQDKFRCIAPDARGFGDSEATPPDWSVSRSADDLEALLQVLEARDVRDFVLVGHSMGGKVALELAARRPKYLQALVLLAPSPPTPEPMDDTERARLLASHGKMARVEETMNAILARPLPAAIFERCVHDGVRASAGAWRWWLEEGSREDISARVSRIEVPTLVVAGQADQAMTPQVLEREVVARIEGARLETIAEAGHLLPLEAPGEVARLIREQAER